jgi:hypothetical protein
MEQMGKKMRRKTRKSKKSRSTSKEASYRNASSN